MMRKSIFQTVILILAIVCVSCKETKRHDKGHQRHKDIILSDDSIKKRTAEIPALIVGDKEPAHFPGGTGAMKSFIKKTMRYPDVASRLGIDGRVIIKAHADAEGVLSDFSVLETSNAIFNDEAMNIVKAMPRFVPARKDGRQVEDECHIMISFRLDSKNPTGQH